MTKKLRVWSLVGLVVLAALAMAPATPRSDGMLLLRVAKRQAHVPSADLVRQMRVVQELNDEWIVKVPAATMPQLEAAGTGYQAFDPAPFGDVLYLVRTDAAGAETLRALGGVWSLDSSTHLFACRVEVERDVFPDNAFIKRLSDGLDLVPTFVPASTPIAVRRTPRTAQLSYRTPIVDMVAQIDRQALADTIKKLESFQTRYVSTTACEAAGDWLADNFAAMGLTVERDYFTLGAYTLKNIVATLPGRTAPSQVVIVGAHYDSYSTTRLTFAPGADDNASGTAVVLELARVLSRYSFDFTIKFIAFSGEEAGLYGSKHYAQSARSAGEQILGVINLDMVGYTNAVPEDLDLIVNGKSEWLADTFVAAAQWYTGLPTLKVVDASQTRSDHASFWDQAYSALCGIEDANPTNPNYHKPADVFSTLNMDFETAVARGSAAAVATIAQPFGLVPPPSNVKAEAHVIGTVLMRARTGLITWSPPPGGAAGYYVYRSAWSHGQYLRLNSTPTTSTSYVDRFLHVGTPYYYVVTSVDANGQEGNYSQEVVIG